MAESSVQIPGQGEGETIGSNNLSPRQVVVPCPTPWSSRFSHNLTGGWKWSVKGLWSGRCQPSRAPALRGSGFWLCCYLFANHMRITQSKKKWERRKRAKQTHWWNCLLILWTVMISAPTGRPGTRDLKPRWDTPPNEPNETALPKNIHPKIRPPADFQRK